MSDSTETWLERRSFENMMYFYIDEVMRIYNGEAVKAVFPTRGDRSRLLKRRILAMKYNLGRAPSGGSRGGSKVVLSERARNHIEGGNHE